MTKQEMKSKIDANPKNYRDPVWNECFQQYYNEKKSRLKHGCSGCYRKCYEWLSK
jgi:hypothetical protein